LRLVKSKLWPLIDEDMRNTPEARRIILDLIAETRQFPNAGLRRMNELGVLVGLYPRSRTHRD